MDYASKVAEILHGRLVRVEVDPSSDTLQKKIRNASAMKIPNLLIVGEREKSEGRVTLRRRGHKEQLSMLLGQEFVQWIDHKIQSRD